MLRKPGVSAITCKGPDGEKVVVRRPEKTALSRQVVKHALRLLRQCLDEARVEELLKVNPARADGVAIFKTRDVAEPCWTVFETTELEQLTAPGVLREQSRHAIAIAFYTGLRQSHLRLQEAADVDLDAQRPRITVRNTKSGLIHHVPILPVAAEWLRAWRAHPESGVRYLFESSPRTAYADGYDWGWAPKLDGDSRWPGALERAGLVGRIGRFHDLRHSFESHLLMGTFGTAYFIEEASKMACHTSRDVTEGYAHFAASHLDRKAASATAPVVLPEGVEARQKREAEAWAEWEKGAVVYRLDLPELPPVAPHGIAQVLADPSGFEPLTFGSGGRASSEAGAGVTPSRGALGGQDAARRVLLACADGEAPAEEDLDALADVILEHPDVRAAREVRERGPWALTRAIQLAEKVLQRHPAATSTSLGKVRSSSGPTRHGRRR